MGEAQARLLGSLADLVVLDDDLAVQGVMVGGNWIRRDGDRAG